MDILVLLIAVNLLPLAAVGSLAVPRIRFIIPWLGLATVVLGSYFAFFSSANLVINGRDGVGIGWLMAIFYGLVGLGIVLGYVRLRAIPFVPLGALVAGIIHIASSYAHLPPYSVDFSSMLVVSAPGAALIVYGTILWRRNGLAGSMGDRSLSLRVALALVCVIGLGSMGFLGYQTKNSVTNQWFARPLDLPGLAGYSELVVEGVVTQKQSHSYTSQLRNGRTKRLAYTLYQVKASEYWRGTGPEIISVAVRDYSPVELTIGRSYLLFSGGMADEDKLPGYWHLVEPDQAWTAAQKGFHPYPGLPPPHQLVGRRLPTSSHRTRRVRRDGCSQGCSTARAYVEALSSLKRKRGDTYANEQGRMPLAWRYPPLCFGGLAGCPKIAAPVAQRC